MNSLFLLPVSSPTLFHLVIPMPCLLGISPTTGKGSEATGRRQQTSSRHSGYQRHLERKGSREIDGRGGNSEDAEGEKRKVAVSGR